MSSGSELIKLKRNISLLIVLLIVIGFYGWTIYLDHKTKEQFCHSEYSGKIKKTKKTEQGLTAIMIDDNNWEGIGIYINESLYQIQVGDSIVKEKDSYNLLIIDKSGAIFNITKERFRTKKCK